MRRFVFNLYDALFSFFMIRMIFCGLMLLIILFALSLDKEIKYVGLGQVLECSPVRNHFILGEIRRGVVKIKGETIKNVRFNTDCMDNITVSIRINHKNWGFKSYYSASKYTKNN